MATHDIVAISFWTILIAMIVLIFLYVLQAQTASHHWKTSLHARPLAILVAAIHYMHMHEYWAHVHRFTIMHRYADWSITVPLQTLKFNLILQAVRETPSTTYG